MLFKNTVLPFVLYGCEIWSFKMEEHRLRVIEYRVLRKIYGPKRDEVTGEWRRPHKRELRNMYFSLNIIRAMK
jgi:hypothetical protein